MSEQVDWNKEKEKKESEVNQWKREIMRRWEVKKERGRVHNGSEEVLSFSVSEEAITEEKTMRVEDALIVLQATLNEWSRARLLTNLHRKR